MSLLTRLFWQGAPGVTPPPTTNDVVVSGKARAMWTWRANVGTPWLAIGTHTNLYAYAQGTLTDITPGTFTTGDASASLGSASYGAGAYGAGAYGVGDGAVSTLVEADVWRLDNFGQYPVGVLPSDGRILLWDLNVANNAVPLNTASFPGTTDGGHPTGNLGVVVTPERFLVALGAGGDPRKIQWADQESLTAWTASATNAAGDFILPTEGSIVTGKRSRGETLIFTDVDVWAMRYVGGPLVYAFERVGTGCGLLAPGAVATIDGVCYWMGLSGFFRYNGYVEQIPSEVGDYVFSEFNATMASHTTAVAVNQFDEVWWFYPSNVSSENDRYVLYNAKGNHWSIGRLSRLAGVDRGVFPHPMMVGPDGTVYEHEKGWDHGGLVPFVTSGPMELGAGDTTMLVRRLVPDEKNAGDVEALLDLRFWPNTPGTTFGPLSLTSPTDFRATARQVAVTVREKRAQDWRVGHIRLDVLPGGTR